MTQPVPHGGLFGKRGSATESPARSPLKSSVCLLLFAAAFGGVSCAASPRFLQQDLPGSDVRVFAPGIVSVPGRCQQSITFSADGQTCYYGVTSAKNWNYETIFCTRVLADGRVVTETPSFVERFRFKKGRVIGEPILSPDGKQMFFVANYPPDIWVAERTSDGWGEARELPAPINSDAAEWSPCVSTSGALYFCSMRNRGEGSGRIYKCETVNGVFQPPELLKGPINDDDVGDPAVSPDEQVIVFASPKAGGAGGLDLYISARHPDGTWSKGVNLGSKVNTTAEELGPRISSDGKLLFFYRRERWKDASYSDIYWTELGQFLSLLKQQ